MNEKFEKYIEGLSPELQEKARECKTKEELNAFIAENDLEIPEEALELVSGGCGTSTPCAHTNAPTETLIYAGDKSSQPTINGYYIGGLEESRCTKCGGNYAYAAIHAGRTTDDPLMELAAMLALNTPRTQISKSDYNTYKASGKFVIS